MSRQSSASGRFDTLRPLSGPTGNGRANDSSDIRWVKTALSRLGRYPEKDDHNGLIDRNLVDAIDSYQRDRGLKRDGLLRPDGETEQTLKVELTYLRED